MRPKLSPGPRRTRKVPLCVGFMSRTSVWSVGSYVLCVLVSDDESDSDAEEEQQNTVRLDFNLLLQFVISSH